MNINADYSTRVAINHHELPWISSPEAGVDRRMLARLGGEVAKATSIVRYQPAGTYLMSASGSSNAPFSKEGCTIFVKTGHLLA